jgi:hypothetical protein
MKNVGGSVELPKKHSVVGPSRRGTALLVVVRDGLGVVV